MIGVAGWKNSGKTTLAVKLVAAFSQRGLSVATIKHSHHDVEIEDPATDTARHRRAGARQAVLVSPSRLVLTKEFVACPEPDLSEIVARLDPADLIVVEGYKSAPIPKIEVRRVASASREPLAPRDPLVIAIAADHAIEGETVPVLSLDDIEGLVALVEAAIGPLS